MFNAELAIMNDRGHVPMLAESLPELNTDSWKLFPDGSMETRYRLRAGATWHDGQPLTVDDFVFGWQVYTIPTFGQASLPPYFAIDDVSAPIVDAAIRWKVPYADVRFTTGTNTEFPALPRHLLGPSFQPVQIEALINHPWGYHRVRRARTASGLDRWEPVPSSKPSPTPATYLELQRSRGSRPSSSATPAPPWPTFDRERST